MEGGALDGLGESAGQEWLADLGEMARPLMHHFNNFLNVLLLDIAVLEKEVPENLHAELAEIRGQAGVVATLVRSFQQYGRRPEPTLGPVDLNALINATTELVRAGASPLGPSSPDRVPIDLQLAPNLPLVLGNVPDLKRLVSFLLFAATGATLPDGTVTVITEATSDRVRLRVEDAGPSVAPEVVSGLFDSERSGHSARRSLQLAACEALVRRLQGEIRAENRPAGGVAVVVSLRHAAT
jgi:signal transduction histidine kinase